MEVAGTTELLQPPDADAATLRWIANGNAQVAGVLDEVVARQQASIRWQRRAQSSATALHAQLPYEAPALPLCLREARGSRVVDVDGRGFLDCHLGYTSGILGHAPETVVHRVSEAMQAGVGAGAFVPAQVELAELVCAETGAERVAFFHSGGQAVEAAVRIARAATGRRVVAKFEGCYHGAHDVGLHDPGIAYSGRLGPAPDGRAGIPATGGVLPSPDVLVLPFRDETALELIERHAGRLAAVVLDPHPAFLPGPDPAAAAFARSVREVTRERDVPLVLDEVVTGFRLARGGAQEAFGVRADLACYGKVTSGLGLPLTMVAGRAELLDAARTDGVFRDYRAGKAWVTSTNAGNALSVVAALAQLQHLLGHYDELMNGLDRGHARLRAGIAEIARRTGVALGVHGHPRLMPLLRLGPEPATDGASPYRAGLRAATLGTLRQLMTATFYLRLNGVHVKAVPTLHLSTAHAPHDVEQLVDALEASVRNMSNDRVFGGGTAEGDAP